MPELKKIGLREVRSLQPGEMLWDAAVAGFGIRRQKSAAIAYVLFYRTKEGRQRWHTIGRHGAPWTPETARDEAVRVLGQVVGGKDPAADKKTTRKAATVTELCDLYLKDAEAGRLLTRRKVPKKASTLTSDKGRIERHIKPVLGRLKVASVTSRDIEDFMNAIADGETAGKTKTAKKRGLANVRGGKGTASRTVGLLGGIFTYAVRHRMRSDNPVRGVMRFADGKRERRLTDSEYKLLGTTIQKAQKGKIWPQAIAVVQFLALTGWRSGEALNLRWEQVDLQRRTATLEDTKTGHSVRPLSHAACKVLSDCTRRKDKDLVFQATRGDGPMTGFPKLWAKIMATPENHDDALKPRGHSKKKPSNEILSKDVTPHVLRHSFASLAGDLGYSEPTIAALIGHKGHSVTSRYIHSADAVLLAASDAVAGRTEELMGIKRQPNNVVQIARPRASRVGV